MNNKAFFARRFLALLLATMMIFTIIPVITVFAETESETFSFATSVTDNFTIQNTSSTANTTFHRDTERNLLGITTTANATASFRQQLTGLQRDTWYRITVDVWSDVPVHRQSTANHVGFRVSGGNVRNTMDGFYVPNLGGWQTISTQVYLTPGDGSGSMNIDLVHGRSGAGQGGVTGTTYFTNIRVEQLTLDTVNYPGGYTVEFSHHGVMTPVTIPAGMSNEWRILALIAPEIDIVLPRGGIVNQANTGTYRRFTGAAGMNDAARANAIVSFNNAADDLYRMSGGLMQRPIMSIVMADRPLISVENPINRDWAAVAPADIWYLAQPYLHAAIERGEAYDYVWFITRTEGLSGGIGGLAFSPFNGIRSSTNYIGTNGWARTGTAAAGGQWPNGFPHAILIHEFIHGIEQNGGWRGRPVPLVDGGGEFGYRYGHDVGVYPSVDMGWGSFQFYLDMLHPEHEVQARFPANVNRPALRGNYGFNPNNPAHPRGFHPLEFYVERFKPTTEADIVFSLLGTRTVHAIGYAVGAVTDATSTNTSVTVTGIPAAPTNGQLLEFGVSEINDADRVRNWQTGLTFSRLAPNTQYYIFVRSRENLYNYASVPAASFAISTTATPLPDIGIVPPVAGRYAIVQTYDEFTRIIDGVPYNIGRAIVTGVGYVLTAVPVAAVQWPNRGAFYGLLGNNTINVGALIQLGERISVDGTPVYTVAETTNPNRLVSGVLATLIREQRFQMSRGVVHRGASADGPIAISQYAGRGNVNFALWHYTVVGRADVRIGRVVDIDMETGEFTINTTVDPALASSETPGATGATIINPIPALADPILVNYTFPGDNMNAAMTRVRSGGGANDLSHESNRIINNTNLMTLTAAELRAIDGTRMGNDPHRIYAMVWEDPNNLEVPRAVSFLIDYRIWSQALYGTTPYLGGPPILCDYCSSNPCECVIVPEYMAVVLTYDDGRVVNIGGLLYRVGTAFVTGKGMVNIAIPADLPIGGGLLGSNNINTGQMVRIGNIVADAGTPYPLYRIAGGGIGNGGLLANITLQAIRREATWTNGTISAAVDWMFGSNDATFVAGRTNTVIGRVTGYQNGVFTIEDPLRGAAASVTYTIPGSMDTSIWRFPDNRGGSANPQTLPIADRFRLNAAEIRAINNSRFGTDPYSVYAIVVHAPDNANEILSVVFISEYRFRAGASASTVVRFHFDSIHVDVPVTIGESINMMSIPTPAARYGTIGTPGQVFMGWFIVANPVHEINALNRAAAFDFGQAITQEILDGLTGVSGIPHLYGSWLKFGNVSGNGTLSVSDYTLLQGFFAGLIGEEDLIMEAADVNVDGVVSVADYNLLQAFFAGLSVILGSVSAP